MLLVLFQNRYIIEVHHQTVHPHPDKPLRPEGLKHMNMLPLAAANNRGQQHQTALVGQGEHLIYHLTDGLCRQRFIVFWAAGLPNPRKEQTQVIVDFGDRAHGGAGIV